MHPEYAENNPVSIILAFNHFEITHNGACVPVSRQDSYLLGFEDYYSGGMGTELTYFISIWSPYISI